MNAGINLYSLRKQIENEADFEKTAFALREMGYSYLQYSGGPYDPAMIRRVSEKTGLPVYLTHVPLDRILNETDALMREHESFGCRCIGLGALPGAQIADRDTFREAVAKLEAAGARMRANGFVFSYHHHHFEFFRHGEQTALDYMLENTENIQFTADTYWLQYGGGDVLRIIDRMKGRITCLHLKDYRINKRINEEGKTKFEPGFAPVGEGTLDFAAIVAHAEKAGTRYFFVEQDDATTYPDPLEQVARSIRYIKEKL